jgi:catechol 2,3-dioxygenase-like lactoylglutathione lyase family enzyme
MELARDDLRAQPLGHQTGDVRGATMMSGLADMAAKYGSLTSRTVECANSGLVTRRGGADSMKPLGGPHHFTGVTADVKTNVDFWCRVMGLRFVKNTLNYETTFRYHTYFGDEDGNAGSVVTFLEFEEAPPGVPGDGDIHRLVLRVASYDSLEFWMDRFIANDVFSELLRLDPTQPQSIVFHDPEGHEVELMVSDTKDSPLVADADDIPAEHRIRGIEGRASYTTLEAMLPFAEFMGFRRTATRSSSTAGAQRALVLLEPTGRRATTGASASGTTSPTTRAIRRSCRPRATRRPPARCRGRRSSTTTSSTRATR